MGGGVLQLVLACAGVLLLYRILARLRPGAALQDAVVVITGASSGLGKGWRSADFFFFVLFNLDVDALYKSHHTDKQTFPSSWVVVREL